MIPHLLLLIGLFGRYSLGTELALTSHPRQKRLVYGVPVLEGETASFPSTEYQTNVISAHYCNENLMHILNSYLSIGKFNPSASWPVKTEYVKELIVNNCPIHDSRAVCGGMAITEFAIQTSCHCIARFNMKAHDKNAYLGIPTPWNGWEDMVFSYVGALGFDIKHLPYASKDFIIHESCRQVCNMSISHNFGIIVLRYRLAAGAKMAAPMTMAEMANVWYYVVEKQAVCLVLGWGPEKFEGDNVLGLPSYLLRKSWQVVRSFKACFDIHRSIEGFMAALNYQRYLYKDLQSWSCLTAFGKLSSRISPTDSGSPVTCVNDWTYSISNFAQVATRDTGNTTFTITTSSDLVYSFYENSWEYRKSFNSYVADLHDAHIAPTFRPSLRPYQRMGSPDDELPRQHGGTHSSSALIIFASTFLLILIISFSPNL